MTGYDGIVTVISWTEGLLAEHREQLSEVQIAETENAIGDGDGWLAGLDLLRDGLDQGWLTASDVSEAIRWGETGVFGKFWPALRADLISYRSRAA